MIVSEEELAANYTSRSLISDSDFENGFAVYTSGNRDTKKDKGNFEGVWKYGTSSEEPSWSVGAWWTSINLLENRDETKGEYVLADNKGISYVEVKPQENAVILGQDTEKVYNGASHVSGDMWPHLLIEQINYDEDWSKVPEDKKAVLDLDADKVYVEMDVRVNDYKDLNPETLSVDDKRVVQYNVYLYVGVKDVDGYRTYFGVNPFDNRGLKKNTDFWKDGYSVYMIYTVPTAEIFGGGDTFYNEDGSLDVGEWKKIRVDITPHIENLIRVMNEDNAYGNKVSVEDFWIAGFNAGYEIRGGNMLDMTFKNFNLICYDKK
jgi:hypothetical protein